MACFIFNILVAAPLVSQDSYLVEGRVILPSGTFKDVKAGYNYKKQFVSIPLTSEGAFSVKLAWNSQYLFDFQKPGYITKSVRFSTHVPVDVDKNVLQPFLLMVELPRVMENVDTAYFKNPVGYVRYNPSVDDFEAVTDYDLLVEYNKDLPDLRRDKPEVIVPSLAKKREKSGESMSPDHPFETHELSDDGETNEVVTKEKQLISPFEALSRFKPVYPEGITTDTFRIGRQFVNRYIVQSSKKRSVYLKVSHDWGPTFYFIFYSPGVYRSISQNSFKARLNGFRVPGSGYGL